VREFPDRRFLSEARLDLFVILVVERVLRLHLCELLVKVARPVQIALLDTRVCQQFHDLGGMTIVASLLEERVQVLQRFRIVFDLGNVGIERLDYAGAIGCDLLVCVFLVDSDRLVDLSCLQEGLGI
jgi:hypothetical protein